MFDRCLLCHGPLTFHGISIRPHWFRWLWCAMDDTFFATNEFGALVLLTKKVPKEAFFAKFNARGEMVAA